MKTAIEEGCKMNRTDDMMMKRMKKSLPLMLLAMVLLLSACGQKPVFGMSTNEDNSISITADRGPKDSMGLGYLTVGENEQVVIDAAGMDKGGKLSLRFMPRLNIMDPAPPPALSISFFDMN